MVVLSLAAKAAQAAAKLLKQPSIMVKDTAKFAGKFGKKKAIEHLGETRVKKAEKAIAKNAEKNKGKKKKPKSKKKWTKKDLAHMTKEERKEFSKLRKQQEREARGEGSGSTSGGARIQTLQRPGRVTQLTPGKSPRRLKRSKRRAVEDPRGELKSKGRMFSDDEMKNLEPHELVEERLRPMPTGTSRQIHQMMTGKDMSKSQMDEIEELIRGGDLSVKKHGGKVKSGRGEGKALRGWGKVV